MPRVLVFTAILFGLYSGFVHSLGWKVSFAETNVNAGLLRLQSLADSKGPSAFTVGTSIAAKLDPTIIFDQFNGNAINMGLDGGSAIFAARRILESDAVPKTVIVEANLIMQWPNENMETLSDAADSVTFRLAKNVPILKREYRPVTVLYSKLKLLKDANQYERTREKDINFDASTIIVEYPIGQVTFDQNEVDMAEQWGKIASQFEQAGASVILVMIPDSTNDRGKQYRFSRKLAARYGLPFIDLKQQLAGIGLAYSDGTHLVYQSSQQVSALLNAVLLDNNLLGEASITPGR